MTTHKNGVNQLGLTDKNKVEVDINSMRNSKEETFANDTIGTLSWLNTQFIQRILCHELQNNHISIHHMDVARAVPKGENHTSFMVRVNVEYRCHSNNQITTKLSLIIKSLPEGEVMQQWIEEVGAFVKETRMFEVTFPAMYELAKVRTGKEIEPLATRVYYNDRPNTIVLEDLRPQGYKMASRCDGLDLKHSVLALKTLAKFHGLSVALNVKDPTIFDTYTLSMWSVETRHIMAGFLGSILKGLVPMVCTWPGFERFEEKVKKLSENGLRRVNEMTKAQPGSFRVLCHGDFWISNMMFHYDKDETVDDVKMVDFQWVNVGSPVFDIIYFLYTSTSQQVLEDHRQEMLEQYHDALCDTMRRMGCDQDLFISLDQLHQEMEDKAFFAVVVSCMICTMLAEKDEVPDFTNISEEEMEKGQIEVINKAICSERFRKVFQRRFLIFESQGLI